MRLPSMNHGSATEKYTKNENYIESSACNNHMSTNFMERKIKTLLNTSALHLLA